MSGSTHSSPLVRSRASRSAALALGLLVAGCDSGTVDPQSAANTNAAETTANAAGSAPRAQAPSADTEPYQAFAARRGVLIADAVEALDETYAALGLLAERNEEGAVEALARATGKLEVVLAAEPGLALAPVAVDVRTYDVLATPGDIERVRRFAEDALDDGRIQEGRRLIRDLASEHVFSVTNLPLATYPNALRQAATLIRNGRPLDAVATLEAALATQVVEETIIPLPLVRAQVLLERARPAAEEAARTPEADAAVRELLSQARQQLDLARALGYATRSELDDLYAALGEIRDRVEGRGSARGLFDRLKSLFDAARQNDTGRGNAQSPQETGPTN